MTLKSPKWLLAVSALIACAPTSATAGQLTLDDCVRLALAHSPALHSSQMKVDAAEAQLGEINAARLPSLGLSAGYTRLSDIDPFAVALPGTSEPFTFNPNIPNTYAAGLVLNQPLFTGLRLEKTSAAMRRNLEASRLDYEAATRELRFAVIDAYWTEVKANEFQTIIDEDVARQEAHFKDVQNLFAQGLVNRNEVLRVEVQHSNALLQQISVGNARQLARANLENVVGVPLVGELDMTVPPVSASHPGELMALREMALQNRPEAKAMSQRVQMGRDLAGAAKSGWLPEVALVANYSYLHPNQRIQPLRDEAHATWDIGVYLTYDLWNWNSNGYKARQAQAELAQIRDVQQQVTDGIILQLTHDYLALQEVIRRIEVSDLSLQQTDEGYRITHNLYRQGLAKTSDLLDASMLQTQAKINHSQALIDYQTAKARLETTVGE